MADSTGAAMIAAERARQIAVEGYTAELDDEHLGCELTTAAACYLAQAQAYVMGGEPAAGVLSLWPWRDEDWKPPRDPIRGFVIAGALIAAEIDRLLRERVRVMDKEDSDG